GGMGATGRGMAEWLPQAGAKIAIWGQNAEKNRIAEDKLRALTSDVLVQRIDVADEQAVTSGIADVIRTLGRLDFVAANAGVGGGGRSSFAETTTEQWRRVTMTNLDGVFWTLREACKHMMNRAEGGDPGGSVGVISS